MGWRNDIRLELMREAEQKQEEQCCNRCGKLIESDDPFDQVCTCAYDDWHEEYPDLEEGGDA